MQKITKGLQDLFKVEKKVFKGTDLFKAIAEKKLTVEDDFLKKIKVSATLKNQPKEIIDYFKNIFKDVSVERDINREIKDKVTMTLQENGYPSSGNSPKDIFFASYLLGKKEVDLNLLKNLKAQKEAQKEVLFQSFLT